MDKKTLSLLLVGDIRLSEVAKQALDNGAMAHWLDNLGKIDVVFGNLEGPIGNYPAPDDEHKCCISSVPGSERTLASLAFNVLSLANNHSMDFGSEGLTHTIKALNSSGIQCVGAGRNIEEARRLVVLKRDSSRFGFLAYAWDFIQVQTARANEGSVAPLEKKIVLADIASARKAVDWLLVSVHWSYERERFPLPYQRDLAHAMIDAGASIVVGHHAHVIQGIERYKGCIILYSLGNFIFPDIHVGEWNIRQSDENRLGLAAKIEIQDARDAQLEIVPFRQEGAAFIPTLLTGSARETITRQIDHLSAFWNPSYSTQYQEIRFRKNMPVMTGVRAIDWIWRFQMRLRALVASLRRRLYERWKT